MKKVTNAASVPGNAVLPLPPLDYDVAYMNNLIRLLNYYFQQLNNPGLVNGTSMFLSDGLTDNNIFMNTTDSNTVNTVNLGVLPTSAAGLASGQVWNNAGVLNIVP